MSEKIKTWVADHYFNLIIFHGLVLLLFLLRSAGYFNPFLPISVNFIVLTSLVLSVFILGARSRAIFIIALAFWLFAGLIRIMQIEVWAERTAIYAYESLVLGVILLLWPE